MGAFAVLFAFGFFTLVAQTLLFRDFLTALEAGFFGWRRAPWREGRPPGACPPLRADSSS